MSRENEQMKRDAAAGSGRVAGSARAAAPTRPDGSARAANPQPADPGAPVPEKLSVKANMLWNSVGSMTYLACQWLVTIVVVRLASGAFDDAGVLSLAMSVVGIFGTFANYKMGTYQISDIRRENTVGEYMGFRCLTLAGAFIACMIYAALTCSVDALLTIALFYVFKGVGLLIDILHGVDQVNRRMDYIGKSFMLQGVSTLAAFAAIYAVTQNLNAAIVAMMVAAAAVLVLFDLPHCQRFERVRLGISRKKALFFLRTSLPAVIASVAASAIFTIPKQYLALRFGDASLGVYASVAAPALIIQMGAQYLYGPLLDIFPTLFFKGDRRGFVALLGKTVAGIIAVAVVCAIVLEFIGTWALELLFGETIAPYVYLLQPIILSTAATAFLWFFGDLLITLRNFWANFAGNVAAFVAVVPLTFLCVNEWGGNGVSFAGTGACLVGVVLLLVFLVRAIRRGPDPLAMRGAAGVGAGVAGAGVGVGARGGDRDDAGSQRSGTQRAAAPSASAPAAEEGASE